MSGNATSPTSTPAYAKAPLLAFVSAAEDMATLKAFASGHGWPESSVHQGTILTAAEHLKNHPSPALLVVEIGDAKEAPAQLDKLADVCDPDTKVVAIGAVNEYSFYCWLMDLGIFSYLLRPLTQAALQGAYEKSQAKPAPAGPQEKQLGKIIAVIGARGGVGASTLAINLAGVLAETGSKSVGLIDADPQEGSIGLMLDLEPSRGLREALEKPDRIDSLFIDRVVTRLGKQIAVLSAEEALHDTLTVSDQSAEPLIKELRTKFEVTVLDLPHALSTFGRQCLKLADHRLLVTELTLVSLRDCLRFSDLMRDHLKVGAPMLVANRVGLAAKHEVPLADFESGVGGKIAHRIPYAPDLFMKLGVDIPAVKQKSHLAAKPLYALAEQLVPHGKPDAKPAKGGFSLLKKKES